MSIKQEGKMVRWRPRFTVRTLTIAVTLVCMYLGAWELTKRFGVMSSQQALEDYETMYGPLHPAITSPSETSPAPFIVRRIVYGYMHGENEYYLWVCGRRVKLIPR